MSVPGSGGGTVQNNLLSDRMNTLNSYLADLLMIPAIKESNALKEFLQIDQYLPKFYNGAITKIE
jgi:hypothetical protein